MSLLSDVIEEVNNRPDDERESNNNRRGLCARIVYSFACVFLLLFIVLGLYNPYLYSFLLQKNNVNSAISVVDGKKINNSNQHINAPANTKRKKENSVNNSNELAHVNVKSNEVGVDQLENMQNAISNTRVLNSKNNNTPDNAVIITKQALHNEIFAAIKLKKITVPKGRSALDYYIRLNEYFPNMDHTGVLNAIKSAYVEHIDTLIKDNVDINANHVLYSMSRLKIKEGTIKRIKHALLASTNSATNTHIVTLPEHQENTQSTIKNTIVKITNDLNDYELFASLLSGSKNIKKAEAFIQNNSDAFYAYIGLGYAYYSNKSEYKLANLSDKLHNRPGVQAYLNALTALVKGDMPNALIEFEKINIETTQWTKAKTHVLTLTSALYLEQNAYHKAYSQYKTLTEMNDKNPQYWLGLALSSQNINDTSTSLAAYKKAALYSKPNSTLFTYASQQVNKISQHDNIEVSQW